MERNKKTLMRLCEGAGTGAACRRRPPSHHLPAPESRLSFPPATGRAGGGRVGSGGDGSPPPALPLPPPPPSPPGKRRRFTARAAVACASRTPAGGRPLRGGGGGQVAGASPPPRLPPRLAVVARGGGVVAAVGEPAGEAVAAVVVALVGAPVSPAPVRAASPSREAWVTRRGGGVEAGWSSACGRVVKGERVSGRAPEK